MQYDPYAVEPVDKHHDKQRFEEDGVEPVPVDRKYGVERDCSDVGIEEPLHGQVDEHERDCDDARPILNQHEPRFFHSITRTG